MRKKRANSNRFIYFWHYDSIMCMSASSTSDTDRFLSGCKVLNENNYGATMELMVVLLSFNQARFLTEAIESVLCQEWSENWRLFIHDDASNDSGASRKIILEYAERHPEKIVAYLQTDNKFLKGIDIVENLMHLYKPNFVARLDGDDLFLTKNKLQRQLKLMKQNPCVSMVYHPYIELEQLGAGGTAPKHRLVSYRSNPYSLKARMALGNAICTATVMFRYFPDLYLSETSKSSYIRDYPLWALLGKRGDVLLQNDCLSVYRRHGTNGFAGHDNNSFKDDTLRTYQGIIESRESWQQFSFKLMLSLRKFGYFMDRFGVPFTSLINVITRHLLAVRLESWRDGLVMANETII